MKLSRRVRTIKIQKQRNENKNVEESKKDKNTEDSKKVRHP